MNNFNLNTIHYTLIPNTHQLFFPFLFHFLFLLPFYSSFFFIFIFLDSFSLLLLNMLIFFFKLFSSFSFLFLFLFFSSQLYIHNLLQFEIDDAKKILYDTHTPPHLFKNPSYKISNALLIPKVR